MKTPTGYYQVFLFLGVLAVVMPQELLGAKSRAKKWQPRAVQGTMAKDTAKSLVRKKTEIPNGEIGPTSEGDREQRRYEQAKARAKDDSEVKMLKAKADEAMSEDEARRTSIAYNRALFQKMREIDHSVSERIDLVEAAILKRIVGGDL